MVAEALLTISDVANETGLSVHTLRYYERVGLLTPVERAGSGHRRYSRDDLRWIRLLICLRHTGMSIAGMQEFAQVQREGDPTGQRRRGLFEAHRARVLAQQAETRRMLDVIEHKLDMFDQIKAQLDGTAGSSGLPRA